MKSNAKFLVLITLVSLLLNLGYVVFFADNSNLPGDTGRYDELGWRLAQGRGFPVEGWAEPYRPPLYPVFLAAVYKIFGYKIFVAKIAQAVLVSLVGVLVFLLARDIFRKSPIAYAASLLAVFYPGFIFYNGILYRENLLAFFLLLAVFFLARFLSNPSRPLRYLVISGLLFGITTLICDRVVYFPLVLFWVFFLCLGKVKTSLKFTFIFLLCMGLVISPWTIRNYLRFHEFILVEKVKYRSFWLSTHPGEFLHYDFTREPLKSYKARYNEDELDRVLAKEAIQNLKKYPLAYGRMSLKRFFRFWIGGHSNVVPGRMQESLWQSFQKREVPVLLIKSFLLFFNLTLIMLGFIGIYLSRRSFRESWLLSAIIFYIALIHTLTFATPRYQIPVMPYMLIFAAYSIYSFSQKPLKP